MRDALYTARTRRYVIGTVLTGRQVRTAAAVAGVAAQVAAGTLTTLDGASFGLFDSNAFDDSCSITSGAAVLTSPGNPWALTDVGKAIDVQGAGAAGATLRSRIIGFTNAGSITLQDNAATTVAASMTSAGGLAIWGNDYNQSRALPVSTNEAGTTQMANVTETIGGNGNPAGRSNAAMVADIANVKNYGAIGDGAIDDTAAIQRAINSGAGRVQFPAGKYRTTATLTIVAATILEGIAANGPGDPGANGSKAFIVHDFNGTCLDFVGSAASNTIAAGPGVRDLTILQNDGNATGASGVAIRGHSVSDVQRTGWLHIENVHIEEVTGKNGWSYCIDLDGTANPNLLRDVFIRGCRFVSGALATASVRLAGVVNVFLDSCEGNLVNGGLVITGDGTHMSSSIFVSNSTFASVSLDFAQNVYCNGGASSTYVTTANTIDTIATGWHTTVSAPTILGTRNTVIGKLPTGETAWTTNNTVLFVVGANDVRHSGPVQATAFRSASANPAATGVVRLANGDKISARNNANNADKGMLLFDGSDRVQISPDGAGILWGAPVKALGGGAAPTVGTIGATGPATAAQNSWLPVSLSDGSSAFIPVWK